MIDRFVRLAKLWPFHEIDIGRLDEYQYIPIRLSGSIAYWRARMPGEVKMIAPIGSIPISRVDDGGQR